MAVKAISGEAHFFEDNLNFERIKKLLDNKTGSAGISEKLEAMKSLLAMISKGQDVSNFFANVVKNVVVSSVEVKKLVYMYLVHYADANAQCRELALLSINSFQKDLADHNQLIRALALRIMTSIRVRDIIQIQVIAIKKCAADSSPYVRKTAANAISKVYLQDQNPEQKEILLDIIARLLKDSSTMVLGSAVQALSEVSPNRLDLLHTPFRKLCHLLADIDEWGQIVTINMLMRYTRQQFLNPSVQLKDVPQPKELFPKRKVKRGFYSDEEGSDQEPSRNDKHNYSSPFHLGSSSHSNSSSIVPDQGSVFSGTGLATGIGGGEELDEDHRLLLRCSLPLLKSRNSGVVLAVSSLHYYCGTQSIATSALIGKSLVRIMRNQREIQYVVLSVIATMASERPDMFRPFLHDFFVRATDPAYSRKLKLGILTALTTDDSVSKILKEFQAYVKHSDKNFVTATVRAIGRVADALPGVSDRCLRGLMRLVRSTSESVVAESVVVIRQLLQRNPSHECVPDVVRRLAAMMGTIESPSARASIVWILGNFRSVQPKLVPDCLRILAGNFSEETPEVKIQILNLAVKLALSEPETKHIQQLLQYVIELSKFDQDYDLRDRARWIRTVLSSNSKAANAHSVLMTQLPPPMLGPQLDDSTNFVVGSLSAMVKHSVYGYCPLPDWPEVQPDKSVRDVSEFQESSNDDFRRHANNDHSTQKKSNDNGGGFYSSEEDSESEYSDSESGSESDSERSSETSEESDSSYVSGSDEEEEEEDDEEEDAYAEIGEAPGPQASHPPNLLDPFAPTTGSSVPVSDLLSEISSLQLTPPNPKP